MSNEENIIEEEADYLAASNGTQTASIRADVAARPRPLPTGLAHVDRMLGGGFEYGKLYVLASAPGMGKTTLANQIAVNISAHGNDVIYVSLAEDTIDLMIKDISRCSLEISAANAITTWQLDGAYRGEIRYLDFSDGQREIMELARERHVKRAKKLYIVDIPISMDELESIVESHEFLLGNKPFVVIDFLQLLSLIGESDKQKCLSISDRDNNNVMRLKKLTFKHKIPILVLTSVCSTSYYTSVSLESLNHAGGIENTADVVLGLQPSKYSFNDSRAGKRAMAETMAKDVREMSLSCVKNHDGKFCKVELRYHAAYSFFEEMK